MKRFIVALALILVIGCGAGAINRNAYLTTVPQPGNPQKFDLYVTNLTQVDIAIGPILGQTLIIPPQQTIILNIGFLPANISIDAQTITVPVITFPTRTLVLGQDYNNYSTYVAVSFP